MSGAVSQLAPTAVEDDAIAFRLADPERDLPGVRLWCDVELGADLGFTEVDGGWELRLSLPELDCLEYLFEVPTEEGQDLRLDPGNPESVGGAFGEHSWLPLPGYRPPAWLSFPSVAGERSAVTVDRTPVGTVAAEIWQPVDPVPDQRLPLLVVHDGPEMDRYGGLTHYVGSLIQDDRLPRMRVALLEPGARNERYAADPAYAAALTNHVVPRLLVHWPSDHRPVLVGQSLGGLAALHAAWTSPRTFAGLMLQSGSFFTPELDPQESEFEFWQEVTSFVASVHAAREAAPEAPPVTLTCGTAEENYANNELMAGHLADTGIAVSWGEARQGHTWTCWRDLLDPHLTDLLRKVWD